MAAVIEDVDSVKDDRMPRWDFDDARLVNAAIARALLCVECLIRETGVTRTRVTAILTTIDPGQKVTSALAPCESCLRTKRVFRRP